MNRITKKYQLVGWTAQPEAGFGNEQGQSIKYKIINLISAVRTLMRSKWFFRFFLKKSIALFIHSFCFLLVPLIGINIVVIIYELLLG